MIHGKYWTFDNRAALYPKLIASVILSRHRRIKKQRRYERLAATSQLFYPVGAGTGTDVPYEVHTYGSRATSIVVTFLTPRFQLFENRTIHRTIFFVRKLVRLKRTESRTTYRTTLDHF